MPVFTRICMKALIFVKFDNKFSKIFVETLGQVKLEYE